MNSLLGSNWPLSVKRKIFVSYHHGGDQGYYNEFSRVFHDEYEAVFDNSLERKIDSANTDYIMRQIRENFITGTSCTIVLVGYSTYQRKYVDWEIKATLDKGHGLIGVRLPSARVESNNTIVPARLYENIRSGYAVWTDWKDLTSSAMALQGFIEQANSRSKSAIINPLETKGQNG